MLFAMTAKAQNIEVSGLQSGSWDADTVFVTNNVIVEDALHITSGTTVVFNGFYNINVRQNATLEAIGTSNDSILFTVADTTGFHIFNSGRGGWNGIRMEKSGACRFDYCRFQYGKAALDTDQDGGALRIFDCDAVEIGHSTLFCNFSREHGGALNAEGSNVAMHDCNVINNLLYSEIDTIYFMYGGGLRFMKCKVDITTTDFRCNIGESAIGGALSIDSCSINIDRCRFEHNIGINGAGLYMIRCFENPCTITNSLFANNTSGHFGGGLAISDSSPLMSNLTVVGNHSIGVNCGGIFFYQHSSPTVWNCVVYGNTNNALLEMPVQIWSWTYDGYAPEFHNCLVQFGFDNISNHDVITVYNNCLDEDPFFADTTNEDYHLTQNSPCVNAGSSETPTVILEGLDLDGMGRINAGAIDMGAYEYDLDDIPETAQNESLFHIIGNPITAMSYAEINLEKGGPLYASLYTMDGKLVNNKVIGFCPKGPNRIELGELFQQLPSGAYLFVVKTAEKTLVTKSIKP